MRPDLMLRGALILVTGGGAATAIVAQVRSADAAGATEAEIIAQAPAIAATRVNADSLIDVAAGRNPFRTSRSRATVAFDPSGQAGANQPPAAPPRPSPVLAGIMLGASPAALIDGIPGSEGTRLLRQGESFGSYRVRELATDRVVLEGPDTTWVLRLRRTFQ